MGRFWALAGVLLAFAAVPLKTPAAGEPEALRKDELRYLLKQDCGACHGMSLRGGLGVPLLPDNLAGLSDADLKTAILDGRPGTAMPPWRALLSNDDVDWLIHLLRDGGPHETR